MYAQHHSRNSAASRAAIALLFLEASTAYSQSNNARRSFVQRIRARQECRGHLNEIRTLEQGNAAALDLLGRKWKGNPALAGRSRNGIICQ